MQKYTWLVFVITAALCWGAYVPTIHHGQLAFGRNPNASMRAFLFIGIAYFLMAVLIPGLWLLTHRDPADPGFNWNGSTLSTIAGILGAVGALAVVFALKFGGHPIYVAPLVFAGAPIMNVLVSMIWDRHKLGPPQLLFYVGLLLAALGAAMVLRYKPETLSPPSSAPPTSTAPGEPN